MKDTERKRYQNLATRNRRALMREKEQYGYYDDGGGKRYRIGVYFVLADRPKDAQDYYRWYAQTFPDDCGEPISFLYWTLAEYRCADEKAADLALRKTMLSNPYLLPFLIGKPITTLNIWHGSNREYRDYLDVTMEFLKEPTAAERQWIETRYTSEIFSEVREAYIDIFHKLKDENATEGRCSLLSQWNKIEANFLGLKQRKE